MAGGDFAAEKRAGGEAPGDLCRNCGTRRIGDFCHHCGQSANIHNSFRSILSDLVTGAFSFEGKIARTLPMLVFRPGELTRRYIAGERARLVSPLVIFVFSVFLLFAAFEALDSRDVSSGVGRGAVAAGTGFDRTEIANAAAVAKLEERRAAIVSRGQDPHAIDREIAERREEIADLASFRNRLEGREGGSVTGWPWLDQGIARVRTNPDLVLSNILSNAHEYSWALIPLSTPLVAMLFLWRRRFTLYDHAIFTIYSISFMSLLVVAMEVLAAARVTSGTIVTLLLVAAPAHMFAQLRGAYRLSFFSAAWRTLFLALAAAVTLLLFILAAVALGISG